MCPYQGEWAFFYTFELSPFPVSRLSYLVLPSLNGVNELVDFHLFFPGVTVLCVFVEHAQVSIAGALKLCCKEDRDETVT